MKGLEVRTVTWILRRPFMHRQASFEERDTERVDYNRDKIV